MTEYLLIQKKILEMIEYNNIMVLKFPKHEKFLLANMIREAGYNMLKFCISANKRIFKKTDLTSLNTEHEFLRQLINLSFSLKYINSEKHRKASLLVDETGRMIGAWIKQILGKGNV